MRFIKPSWLTHGGKSEMNSTWSKWPWGSNATHPALLHVLMYECGLLGEKKEFEVYSCHVSSDGARLATAGGGTSVPAPYSVD